MARTKTQPRTSRTSKTKASDVGITADLAKKILQADLARIVQKVKDKKPLTAPERNLMSQMANEEGADMERTTAVEEVPDHVPSISSLAGILGVSRRSIQLWRKKFANEIPANRTNGDYDVAAWREFLRRKGLKEGRPDEDEDEEDLDSLKKRDLRARAEEREFKVKILMGEYVHREDVREEVASLVAETIKLLRDKLENELPPVCAGLDALRIRAENARVVDEICDLLHRGEIDGIHDPQDDDGEGDDE